MVFTLNVNNRYQKVHVFMKMRLFVIVKAWNRRLTREGCFCRPFSKKTFRKLKNEFRFRDGRGEGRNAFVSCHSCRKP